ncbi:hypothetical protein BDN72DRAFT_762703 [Pluteus cervinus]|uniref:Uncharacterized protein n=1 Tax=Pluteus cervinus TaxID=181527 RepID=A0ACD3B5E3_9AGAR|nr:hypothetical protein BDN72DRAFT_762703 [Pluteus cervinus]
MSSKEKRQLRNKISARNFRVRRKEYISTLEGDIAERDRLLDAIRTELGESRNENQALRQEIATLKKVLLDGRGSGDAPMLNLPPPAPLPAQSAAATLAASNNANAANAAAAASNLLTANPHKDLPNSPRLNPRAFWGGVGMGMGMGGITPVHTALMPEVLLGNVRSNKVPFQENINPSLNLSDMFKQAQQQQQSGSNVAGFDGFADLNPFTMKTLDAYRMHLWGKMAAQQQAHQQQQRESASFAQANQLSGLASGLRPHFLLPSASTAGKLGLSSTAAVSSLLSGKHATSHYPTPPSSPRLGSTTPPTKVNLDKLQKEQQTAAFTALASQTLFKKLGSAFWDAFSGSSPSPSTSSPSLDTDKVRRVLEGKAVVRVVDIEPATPVPTAATLSSSSPLKTIVAPTPVKDHKSCCTELLEESMRSLTLGKKNP